MKQPIVVLAVLLLGTQLWAQDLKPTEAHKIFAADAGTWDAVVKMYFRGPKGPATESAGVESNELVSGGMCFRRTFKYKIRDKEFEGHGLFGYDPRSQEYVGTWVDNRTAVPTALKGKYDSTSKTLTMLGTVVDGSGNEFKQKQITTFIDDQTKKLEILLVIDADGKSQEIKIMEMTAKKRS